MDELDQLMERISDDDFLTAHLCECGHQRWLGRGKGTDDREAPCAHSCCVNSTCAGCGAWNGGWGPAGCDCGDNEEPDLASVEDAQMQAAHDAEFHGGPV